MLCALSCYVVSVMRDELRLSALWDMMPRGRPSVHIARVPTPHRSSTMNTQVMLSLAEHTISYMNGFSGPSRLETVARKKFIHWICSQSMVNVALRDSVRMIRSTLHHSTASFRAKTCVHVCALGVGRVRVEWHAIAASRLHML